METYTPSNGCMIVCSDESGEYVKRTDHVAAMRKAAETIRALHRHIFPDECERTLKGAYVWLKEHE